MLNRLLNILNQDSEDDPHQNQLETVIEELSQGIKCVQNQHQKIAEQEGKILAKLHQFETKHQQKLDLAKQALKENRDWHAKSLFTESEIIDRQVKQYQRIASETHKTKRKLLAQENQFLLMIDQLSTQKALGEANVDASQIKAEISEQMMFLNESDELSKFDELIMEAECKSQALEEIQGKEASLEEQLTETDTSLDKLQQMISDEKKAKMNAALKDQQKIIERVFGKLEPEEDKEQKETQMTLLNQLKQCNTKAEAKDRINRFFNSPENETLKPTQKTTARTTKSPASTKDKEDRIRNFFK